MTDFFTAQIDYILFFYGLAFIMLSTVCFIMTKAKIQRLPWIWLGIFGLTHGAHEWLDILASDSGDGSVLKVLSIVFTAVSFLFLAEFARVGIRDLRGRGPGRWMLIPLAAISAAGLTEGWEGLAAVSRYAIGLPAGLLSAYLLFKTAGMSQPPARRWMSAAGMSLGLYALSSIVTVSDLPFFHASLFTLSTFLDTFGFPVQLLRGLFGVVLALSLWAWSQTPGGGSSRKPKNTLLPVAIFIVILSAGWAVTNISGEYAREEDKREGGLYADALSDNLDHMMEDTETTAALKADSPRVLTALLTRRPKEIAQARASLNQCKYTRGADMPLCYLYDARGGLVTSCDCGAGKSAKPAALHPGTLTSPSHDFVFDSASKVWYYYAGFPVKDGRGRIMGSAVVIRNLKEAEAAFRRRPYSFLVDPHGIVFLSSSEQFCMKSLWPAAGDLQRRAPVTGRFGSISYSSLMKEKAVDGRYVSFEGRQFLVTSKPLGTEGWSIIYLNSTRHIRAYRLFSIFTTFFFFSTTLVFFSVLYFSRESSARIAASERALRAAKDELEVRVEERTSELAHVNDKLIVEIAERRLSERALGVSEEKYKNLVELTPDIIYLSDIDGNIMFVNNASHRVLDIAPEQLIGRPLIDMVHPDDRELTSRKFEEIIRGGMDVFDFENRFVSVSGRTVNILHNVRIIRNEKGEATGTQGIARDITERKRVEEVLRAHDLQQRAILNNIPDMAWLKDRECRYIATNESFGKVCGVHPEDIPGTTDFDIWPRHLAEKYRADDIEVMETGLRKQIEEPLVNQDGRKIWIESIKTPIYADSGEVIGTTGISRDITERKRTEEKLKLFSQAIEEAMDGVQLVDLNGRVIFSNRAVEEMYGFSAEELLGRDVNDMNADPEFASREILPAIREKGRWSGEVSVVHKYGREFPIWLSASVVKDSGGEPIAMVGIIRDMTERKQSEEELSKHREHLVEMVEERTLELQTAVQFLTNEIGFRKKAEETLKESEARFRELSQQFHTLLDAIPDILLLLTPDLKVLWANRSAALSLLGERDLDPRGKYCYELWHGSCSACKDCHVMDTFRTGEAQISQRPTNGRLFDSKAFPIKDDDGSVVNVIIVVSDITEKTTLEAEAMRASHLASLGELAAGVAHEINNPINGIINYAQMILNKNAEETREHDISARIIKEGKRIAGIVRSLLSFARERREEKNLVSIPRILYDTITLTEAQIRKDGIHLHLDVPESLPAVFANPQQLQQVFLNIMSNARYALNRKYPLFGEEKILSVSCEQTTVKGRPCVEITFFDRGIGIAADIIDKVMNPFFSTKPSGEGTGLGLSISHGIIKDHDGRLVVESSEGDFTKVTIQLPTKEENGG